MRLPSISSRSTFITLAALVCLAAASRSNAQSVWTNPAGGDIATPSNWSGSIPPSATQDGYFTLSNSYTAGVSNDFTAQNLAFFSGTVTFDLAAGKTLFLANGGGFGSQGGTIALTDSGTLISTGFGVAAGGSLSINTASVQTGYLAIGTGKITQSSGSVQTGEFMVGTGSGASGRYDFSGGQILITGTALDGSGASFRVGDFTGSGTFNQTGGLVQLITTSTQGNSLNIGNQGGSGVYNISSGTLGFSGAGLVTLGRSADANPAGSGILNISGNSLVDISGAGDTAAFIIGDNIITGTNSPNNGYGIVNQTSGTLSIHDGATLYLSGYAPTISGTNTYNLTGGVLAIGGNSLKGAFNTTSPYAFNLGGGTIRVTGSNLTTSVNANLVDGSTSTIDTNGLNAAWSGSITGTNAELDKVGTGTLALSGNNTIRSFFVDGGSVSQASGTMTSQEIGVGSGVTGTTANVGVYNLSGGTVYTTPPSGTAGMASSFRVGDFGGSGTFNQTGGHVINNGALNIGNQGGHGVYAISSGTLDFASGLSTLGRTNGGSASSGGSTGELDISGSAVVNLNASSQFTLSNWYLYTGTGAQGNGVLNQTGGLFTVDNAAILTLTGYGHGIYNLTSGTLQIGGTSLQGAFGQQNGTYEFNLGGGTVKVYGSDLTTSVNASLVDGSTSKIDTNGLNTTWSGNITGTNAELDKVGTGTLALSGNNTIRSFFVDGGSVSQASGTMTSQEIGVGSGVTGTTANVGVYNLSGGTVYTTPPSGTAGMASSFRVGDFGGSGTFNQTGGHVINNGALNIGNQGGHGVYAISSGTLDFASGLSTLGRTNGGSASSGGSTGELDISGSAVVNLNASSELTLSNWYAYTGSGAQGSGVLNQTGGLFTVDNAAILTLTGFGHGIYNLTSGTLQIGGSTSLRGVFGGQNGTYDFNLGGGSITVSGSSLVTDVNANLVAGTADIGPASKIDTNGLNATWSGSISGAQGGLIKAGSGTLTFNGSGTRSIGYFNTDQGTTRQTAGVTTSTELVVGGNYSAKNGSFTLDGGTINVTGSTPASSTSSLRVGDFGGTGAFTQNDGVVNADGAVVLGNRGGVGSYTLASGTFNVGEDAIPGTTGMIVGRSRAADATASSGTLNITGGLLHLFAGAALQIGGEDLSDARSVGVVNQSGDSQVIVEKFVQLADTGTGTYNLNGGSLTVGGANGIRQGAGTAAFNLGGGTLNLSSNFSTSVNVTVSGTASTLASNAFTGTFSGAFLGSGLVNKTGSGTMLANSTASTASFAVNQGTLSGTGKTSGSVTVASGATLAGAVSVGGTTTIEQGATFSPGFSPAAVYNDGNLVMAGTMYIELSGSACGTGTFTAPVTGDYDQVLYGGGITLSDDAVLQIASLSSYLPQVGDTFSILLSASLVDFDPSAITVQGVGDLSDYIFYLSENTTSWNGSGSYDSVQLHVEALPEPGTYALLAVGGLLALIMRRRKAALGR